MKITKEHGYKIAISIVIAVVIVLAIVYYSFYSSKINLPNKVDGQIYKLNSISNNINNDMSNYPNVASNKFSNEANTLLYMDRNIKTEEGQTVNNPALLKQEKLYADFSQYSSDYCDVENKLKNIYKETNGFTDNDIMTISGILNLENNIKAVLNSKEFNEMTALYSNKELDRIITYKQTPQEIQNKLKTLLSNLTVSKDYQEVSGLEANTMSPTYKNNVELDNSKEGYVGENLALNYELGPATQGKKNPFIEKLYKEKIIKGSVGGNPAILDFTNSKYDGGNEITGYQIINGVKNRIYLSTSGNTAMYEGATGETGAGNIGVTIFVQATNNSQTDMYTLMKFGNQLTGDYSNIAKNLSAGQSVSFTI